MVSVVRYAAIALTTTSVVLVGRYLLPLLPLEWGFAIGGVVVMWVAGRWLWQLATRCTLDTWAIAFWFLVGLLGSIAL